MIHGGDIYRNHVKYDFSVNTNPYGMPETVRKALLNSVEEGMHYPDPVCESLKNAIGEYEGVLAEQIICSNGASESFLAIVHALQPKCALIAEPSFSGYERACRSLKNCEIRHYSMKKQKEFLLDEGFLNELTDDVDLVFLGHPNNPTGRLIPDVLLQKIIDRCREKNIYLILDECFLDFQTTGDCFEPSAGDHVILVKAFTKNYALPGVRIGYAICSDSALRKRIEEQLPEWNVSSFAQAAGIACTGERAYLKQCVKRIGEQKAFLKEQLIRLGAKVYDSDVNFLLFQLKESREEQLPEEFLIRQGILIRTCESFQILKGEKQPFYRIAIRTEEENRKLIQELERYQNGR